MERPGKKLFEALRDLDPAMQSHLRPPRHEARTALSAYGSCRD